MRLFSPGALAAYVFGAVVPTVVGAMIPQIGAGPGTFIIAASVAVAGADVAWLMTPKLSWRSRMVPILLIVLGITLIGVGAAMLLSLSGQSTAAGTSEQASPPPDKPAFGDGDKDGESVTPPPNFKRDVPKVNGEKPGAAPEAASKPATSLAPTPGLHPMVDVEYCRAYPRPFQGFTVEQLKAEVARVAIAIDAGETSRNDALRAAQPTPGSNSAESLKRFEDVTKETHERLIGDHLATIRNLRCEMLARTGVDRLDAVTIPASGIISDGIIRDQHAMRDVAGYLATLAKGL